ncbi:diaminopimelate decarboxylase [Trinickia dinghuensis]|uniref:Diaminopimelate decarboxylase n=1 Tax=Trinickia dinghuensis TaxID=2291023 RepID=A0A3D8K5Q8_9BURK|nr:diaminopimelate decarboxylase [Trinickia dinghuensis]RDV00649.1 diaminopimelate decarboxylase [Trinickia dinghuensis]
MPATTSFEQRLLPQLDMLAGQYGTPFHIYDEQGIRDTCMRFNKAFEGAAFRQYFAVKALPNPWILKILHECGFGFDCASVPELKLASWVGARGKDLFFTSNNTNASEFTAAQRLGSIVNLDDECYLSSLDAFPDLACFRASIPDAARECDFMGRFRESKFGVPEHRLESAYAAARRRGSQRFGIHAMLCSNEISADRAISAVRRILSRAAEIASAVGLSFEFVNIGGGIGIPYRPDDPSFDLEKFASGVIALRDTFFPNHSTQPAIYTECGRYITGPHGVLVTRVINRMSKWKEIAGVDASMSALMRPALYANAYHHITLPFVRNRTTGPVDVVGSLCENNDKFAVDRNLPDPKPGDLMIVHDTGAHGASMGFNYNGRLRPKELLLKSDGNVMEIRRAEECERDFFSTIAPLPRCEAAFV